MLENFYRPDSGEILLDGVPVHRYQHRRFHQLVSLVAQEPVRRWAEGNELSDPFGDKIIRSRDWGQDRKNVDAFRRLTDQKPGRSGIGPILRLRARFETLRGAGVSVGVS